MLRAFGLTAWIAGACICVVLAVVTGACGGKTHDTSVMADGAPSPSPGCARTVAPRSGTASLRYEGIDRSYDIVIPPTRSDEPMPLVLGYHGYASSPQELPGIWSGSALRDGFVAVFPHGSNLGGSTPAYFNIETVDEPLLADDVGFTGALLDRVEADLCIDRTRIYAMGFSNGGMFVSTLACRLNDRIAAVAPVGGVHLLPDCAGRAVPIIVTHGTSDPVVPFDETDVGVPLAATGLFEETAGGSAQLRMLERARERPVTSWVESWAQHNGCSLDAPEVTTIGDQRTEYTECDSGGDVVLQAIQGGGHEWPTSPTLDATSRALAFFQDHPLPRDALDR
jgi:polyhydroxybutyrate depolymerase